MKKILLFFLIIIIIPLFFLKKGGGYLERILNLLPVAGRDRKFATLKNKQKVKKPNSFIEYATKYSKSLNIISISLFH